MTISHSTSTDKPSKPSKPSKPNPEFPLFPHATGRWAKKIRGKTHYFGGWADPQAALDCYLAEKDDLHAGRTPRPDPEELTLKAVVNTFLEHKKAFQLAGELSPRTWLEYKSATDLIIDAWGKTRLVSDLRQEDFASLRKKMVAKKWGPHRLTKLIQNVRCIFKFAYDSEMIDKPMRFGPGFERPTKKTLRLHRAKQGIKLFAREEIRNMLDAAGVQMKAMILLGINAGFGNGDCGHLPLNAIDMANGWIDYPRPKTGICRRCPLWPETIQALQEAIANRPVPKKETDAGLVFITKYGMGWAKDTPTNPVSQETRKLLDSLGINGHRNFYTLRHTFRTVADEAKDQPAADAIMGHESAHMSSHYRERISDERLQTVTNYVRQWLFGST